MQRGSGAVVKQIDHLKQAMDESGIERPDDSDCEDFFARSDDEHPEIISSQRQYLEEN